MGRRLLAAPVRGALVETGETPRAALAAEPSPSGVAAPGSSSSTGAASEGAVAVAEGRERALGRRREWLALARAEEVWDMLGGNAAPLEQKAAQFRSHKQCQGELGYWQEFAGLRGLGLVSSKEVNEMLAWGEPRRALSVLLPWSTYLRPSSPLAPDPESFLGPCRPDDRWSLLARPAGHRVASEIKEFVDSKPGGGRWVHLLCPPLRTLSKQMRDRAVWVFKYCELLKAAA
ncbi:unnamed protein product, partial [Prorocentrum cordatum]